jgi:lysophospholipase L1-like esterase
LSDAIGRLCAGIDVPYLDSFRPLLASPTFIPSTRAIDGTHPNASGYAEWARLIDEWPAWREWLP